MIYLIIRLGGKMEKYLKYIIPAAILIIAAAWGFPTITEWFKKILAPAPLSSSEMESPDAKTAAGLAIQLNWTENEAGVIELLNTNIRLIPLIEKQYKIVSYNNSSLWTDVQTYLNADEIAQINYLKYN
jgi:hypothetical protein